MKTLEITDAELETLMIALSVASDALWDWDAALNKKIVKLLTKTQGVANEGN